MRCAIRRYRELFRAVGVITVLCLAVLVHGEDVNYTRDLVWQHADGRLAVWIMQGTTLRSGEPLGPAPLPDPLWQIVASADFDSNGTPDVVFQHAGDGRLAVWLMNGAALAAGVALSPSEVTDLHWKIRGAADIDGDAHPDLIWQNQTTGQVSVWLMNGTQLRDGRLLTAPLVADPAWQIVGVGDFNHDGHPDLIWQNQENGLICAWLLDGTKLIDGVWISPNQVSDRSWKIRAVGDLNSDGWPDLIWQHESDGLLAVWLMSGITRMDGVLLSPNQVADTGWRIVATTRSPGHTISITVTGASSLGAPGQTAQLTATAMSTSGASANVTASAAWQSSNPATLTVSSSGVVKGVTAGTATITATYDGFSATIQVTVQAASLVRVLYLIPQDRSFRADYSSSVQNAMLSLESWYAGQLGGRTFSLFSAQPEICRLPQSAAYYAVDSWTKIYNDVQQCAPVSYGPSSTTWVLYADVIHACNTAGRLGAGTLGLTMLGREDLDGLIGAPVFDCGIQYVFPPSRYIGGAGHELGHGFGLSHPPGCDAGLSTCDYAALMWAGYAAYPNTYLRADDKQILFASPFIK
jgi:VCBS repeat protein/Big-like domain-containing protein